MSKNTREKILDAGEKLFSSKGYLGATTKEIANKAGVAELTLFRHFSTKELLFGEVLQHFSFLPVLKEMIPGMTALPYEEALAKIAQKLLLALTLRKNMIRIMHSEISRYPHQIQESYHAFVDEMINTLGAYFDGLIAEGRLREFDTRFGARAFFGMFYAYFNAQEFMLGNRHRAIDTDSVVREFVSIFVAGTLRGGAGKTEAK